jgi:hypothetical protein
MCYKWPRKPRLGERHQQKHMGTHMPEDMLWLQPVLIGAVIVFILDLIGNMISFSNRFMNALATAIVFAVVFGGLLYSGVMKLDIKTVTETPPASTSTPSPAPAPATP